MGIHRAFRRAIRLGIVLLAAIVALLLVLVVAIQLRPLREAALRRTLATIDRSLPGHIEIRSVRWPHLTHLELVDPSWRFGDSPLAEADSLQIEYDPLALGHRELRLGEVHVGGLYLDLPALRKVLGGSPSRSSRSLEEAQSSEPFLPRWGSIPPLPSVAISRLRGDLRCLAGAAGDTVAAVFDLGLDLRRGRAPYLAGRITAREGDDAPAHIRVSTLSSSTLGLDLSLADPGGREWAHLTLSAPAPGNHTRGRWRLRARAELPPREGWSSLPLIRRVIPPDDLPGDLRLRLEGAATVEDGALAFTVDLDGALPSSSLDSLHAELRGGRSATTALTAELQWTAAARTLYLGQSIRLRRVRPLELRLSSLQVLDDPVAHMPRPDPSSTLTRDGEGSWRLHALRLRGVTGDFEIDGALAHGLVRATARSDGRRPPAMLARLSGIDSLLGRWPEDGSYAIELRLFHDTILDSTLLQSQAGLRLPGARLSSQLAWDLRTLHGSGSLDLDDDFSLVDLSVLGDSLRGRVRLDWTLDGPPSALDAHASLQGGLRTRRWDLPHLRATGNLVKGRIEDLRASATGELGYRSLRLDRLALQWRPEDHAHLPSWFALEAEGADFAFAQVLRLSREKGVWQAEVDTLGLRWTDRELHARRPFVLSLQPATGQLRLQGLDLEGSLGSLRGELELDHRSPRGSLELDLSPPPLRGHPLALPSRLRGRLLLQSSTFRLEAQATDLSLSQALPLDARSEIEGTIPTFDGGDAPRLQGELVIEAPRTAALQAVRLRVAGIWGASIAPLDSSRSGAPPDSFRQRLALEHSDSTLAVRLVLEDSLQTLLFGSAHLPFRLTGTRIRRSSAPVRLRLLAPDTDLARLDRWFPSGMVLTGRLGLDLRAEGPFENPRLEGTVHAKDLQAALPGRVRMGARIDLGLQGDRRHPRIEGTIVLHDSQIRIPPRSVNRLPTHGSSLLWETAACDSLLAHFLRLTPAPVELAPSSAEEAPPAIPLPSGLDLDVRVDAPRNLWIRGRGLDVRLTGNLVLSQVDGRLNADGALETTQGTFSFMNKTFRLRRGEVRFYGDPLVPWLDIELGATVGDAEIVVHITGTTGEPELDFQSIPAMDDADIFSYLLFGGPTTRLDQAGSDLVQQQAVNAVEAFAIPQLEGGVASELGISMIQLKQSEEKDQDLSLVVGKYITPQVLLKYEQSLSERQTYTVRLEYWITRHLSLQSFYSEQRSSGVEARIRKDY